MAKQKGAKSKNKKLKKVALITGGVLGVVLTAGIIVGVANNKETKDVGGYFSYEIGTLDESGEETRGDTSAIRMKNFQKVKGLNVELEKNATVTYEIFYYDKDKNFLESLEQTDDYDESELPGGAATAEYFKIVITPTSDAEVSKSEISKYEKQLEVTIDK